MRLSKINCVSNKVTFPQHLWERHYMVPFTKQQGLPKHLEHWQPTVDQMLENVDSKGTIYFMADQGMVSANSSHRRGGIHIDGIWTSSGHTGWKTPWRMGHNTHLINTNEPDQLLLLATDVTASAAYLGDWEGISGNGGDCSFLNKNNFDCVKLEEGKVWLGSALSTLHESLPINYSTKRTLVRLNVCLN